MTNTSRPSGRRNAGAELEWRVGRLYFWSGQFSRTGVDLREHFYPEPLTLTDLDLLAFDISNLLTVKKTIGESKSGTGKSSPKQLDRTFCLAGLRTYTNADAAVLAVATKVSREVREVAERLGVRVINVDELETLETDAGIAKYDFGSYAADLGALWSDIRATAKKDNALERAWKFLRADMWHLDPWLALKRAVAMLQVVSKRWVDGLPFDERRLLQALLVEGSVVFALSAVRVAGQLRWLPDDQVEVQLAERLGEGLAPTVQLLKLSHAVDRYVVQLLDEVNAPQSAKVKAMGAFMPRPPKWAEPFRELATRLGKEAAAAKELPRALDVALYDNVLRGETVTQGAVKALRLNDTDGTFRLARLIGAFLASHTGVPTWVFNGLGLALGQGLPTPKVERGPHQPPLLSEQDGGSGSST